jgi:hypothetical protein
MSSVLKKDRQKVNINRIILLIAIAVIIIYSLFYFKYGIYRGMVFDASKYYLSASAILHEIGLQPDKPQNLSFQDLISQGIGYPLFIALIRIFTGDFKGDTPQVFPFQIAQLILNILSFLMIIGISRLMKIKYLESIVIIAYTLYLPFIYYTAIPLSENLFITILISVFYLGLRFYLGNPLRAYQYFLTGLLLILLPGIRPGYQLFSYLVLVVFSVILFKNNRYKEIFYMSLTFLVIFMVWLIFINTELNNNYFTFSIAGNRTIDRSLYESYNLKDDGWPRSVILNQENNPDYKYNLPEYIKNNLYQTIILRIEKFYRFYKLPAVLYTNEFVIPHWVVNFLHLLIVFLLPFCLLKYKDWKWIFLFLPVLYTAVIYTGYFSEERRFMFTIMPFMIIFASAAITDWKDAITKMKVVELLLTFTPFLFSCILERMNWYSTLPGDNVYYLLIFIFMIISGAGILLIGKNQKKSVNMILAVLILFSLIFSRYINQVFYTDWHKWQHSLSSDEIVMKKIKVSNININNITSCKLQIDLFDEDGTNNLSVKIDGKDLTNFITTNQCGFFYEVSNKYMYPFSEKNEENTLLFPHRRQWLVYNLDRSILQNRDEVQITIENKNNNKVMLFGDNLSHGSYRGPRLFLDSNVGSGMKRISLWKYQITGDIRLSKDSRLNNYTQYSVCRRMIKGKEIDDLSDEPLKQVGSYRIFIQLIDNKGIEKILY